MLTGKNMPFSLWSTEEVTQEFGKRIRVHRLAQNMQQSELAARAGVSERSLRNFEKTGRGNLDFFLRVVLTLGLIDSMTDLFVYRPMSIRDMERAQHYGIAISCFGIGYFFQTLVSWKRLGKWGRVSYITSFTFFALVGLAFYMNPWLDYRVSIQTSENEATKGILIVCYLFCSLAVVASWVKWILEEHKKEEVQAENNV
jgi:transcriptional regulator with XRE-family HTH domain